MPLFEDMPIAVMTPLDEVVSAGEVRAVPEPEEALEADEYAAEEDVDPEEAPVPPAEPPGEEETELEPEESEAEPPVQTTPRAETPAPGLESRPDLSDEDLWQEPPPEPEPRVKRPSSPAPPGELPQRRVVVIDENPDIDFDASREEPAPPPGFGEQRDGMADIGETLDDERGRKRRWRMFRKGGD
jgi:hypothetical protein